MTSTKNLRKKLLSTKNSVNFSVVKPINKKGYNHECILQVNAKKVPSVGRRKIYQKIPSRYFFMFVRSVVNFHKNKKQTFSNSDVTNYKIV